MEKVTLSFGEVNEPGYIWAVYELVHGDKINERWEITARMVNQLVRGGWKVEHDG